MLAKKFINWLPYFILPGAGIALGVLYLTMRGSALAKTFPFYGSFVSLFIMITLERVWTWRHAKSQRHMIWRDLTSTMVQTFLVGGVFGAILLPVLLNCPTREKPMARKRPPTMSAAGHELVP